METMGECSYLLAIKAMTRRFLVQHPVTANNTEPSLLATGHGIHIFTCQPEVATVLLTGLLHDVQRCKSNLLQASFLKYPCCIFQNDVIES